MQQVFDAFESELVIGSRFHHPIAPTLFPILLTQTCPSLLALRRVAMIGQDPCSIRPAGSTS